jgi:hypothetical protein
MELSLSWEAAVVQKLKNFRTFYGTQNFITLFTRALHWSLSRDRSIQLTPPHTISLRYILIISTYLRLGLLSGLFPSGFPTSILHAFVLSPIRATCPWVFIPLTSDEEYTLRSLSLCSFLQSPVAPNYYIETSNFFINDKSLTAIRARARLRILLYS